MRLTAGDRPAFRPSLAGRANGGGGSPADGSLHMSRIVTSFVLTLAQGRQSGSGAQSRLTERFPRRISRSAGRAVGPAALAGLAAARSRPENLYPFSHIT